MRALLALLVLLLIGAAEARAQSCSVSATTLDFPAYNSFSGAVSDASSVVTTTCTGLLFVGVSYEVRLDGGQAGNILGRKMRQGASVHELGYQVYLNAGRSTVLGQRRAGQRLYRDDAARAVNPHPDADGVWPHSGQPAGERRRLCRQSGHHGYLLSASPTMPHGH